MRRECPDFLTHPANINKIFLVQHGQPIINSSYPLKPPFLSVIPLPTLPVPELSPWWSGTATSRCLSSNKPVPAQSKQQWEVPSCRVGITCFSWACYTYTCPAFCITVWPCKSQDHWPHVNSTWQDPFMGNRSRWQACLAISRAGILAPAKSNRRGWTIIRSYDSESLTLSSGQPFL